jgi:hypothetical protein
VVIVLSGKGQGGWNQRYLTCKSDSGVYLLYQSLPLSLQEWGKDSQRRLGNRDRYSLVPNNSVLERVMPAYPLYQSSLLVVGTRHLLLDDHQIRQFPNVFDIRKEEVPPPSLEMVGKYRNKSSKRRWRVRKETWKVGAG